MRHAVVGGAGGFIGHHMVKYLKDRGYWVRGVDIKEAEYEPTAADEFLVLDLREYENCLKATAGVEEVYQLAADMGGIGYITGNRVDISRNNVLINAHMLEAAYQQRREAPLLLLLGVHLPDVQAARPRRDPAQGRGRLPGRSRGGLRLGEALLGEALPVLPGGGQAPDARRALPQHLRPAGHVRGRPREGAGGDQPQGGARERRRRHRDLGRRPADALVHLHRRLRRGHLPDRAVRPLGAAEPGLGSPRHDRRARRPRLRRWPARRS